MLKSQNRTAQEIPQCSSARQEPFQHIFVYTATVCDSQTHTQGHGPESRKVTAPLNSPEEEKNPEQAQGACLQGPSGTEAAVERLSQFSRSSETHVRCQGCLHKGPGETERLTLDARPAPGTFYTTGPVLSRLPCTHTRPFPGSSHFSRASSKAGLRGLQGDRTHPA